MQTEAMQWHKHTIDFTGPNRTENAETFRDFRLDVTFTNQDTGETLTIPGFWAADGDAANTSASEGAVWRVHFNPPSTGEWTYEASFRTGEDVAVSLDPNAGQSAGFFDGETGSFDVIASDKTGDDFRAKGMILQDDGTHYLQHQGDGDYFIRGGPGVPENFLAVGDFDGARTFPNGEARHVFEAHAGDYNAGDPSWGDGQGQNIIGAVNYVAEQGLNTLYVMTLTAGGDGKDVWPWASEEMFRVGINQPSLEQAISNKQQLSFDDFSTYDASKLDQWGIVFDHMDAQGIYINLLLQETENDHLLNGGTPLDGSSMSVERALYLREMVARFGHLNGLQWNLGEENTNDQELRVDMANYVAAQDGYDHLVVLHTFPHHANNTYDALLGVEEFDGPSFQRPAGSIRKDTINFRDKSAEAGDPWVLGWDEDSTFNGAIDPGTNDPDQANEQILREGLWGHLTVNGTGVNWYLRNTQGHGFDQNIDDFTGFTSLWTWTAAATDFFNTYIPFWDMTDMDDLTPNGDDFVFVKEGEYYLSYRPYGTADAVTFDLSGQDGASFDVFWYDPRTGGDLIDGGQVSGGGAVSVGAAPADVGKDWVVLLRNTELPDAPASVAPGEGGDDPASPPPPPPPPVDDPITPPADGDLVLAFNAGGNATVLDGVSYEADRTLEFLATGSTLTYGGKNAVHTGERYGEAFTLDIPLADGLYDVTLNFAEVFFNAAGKRVFDVSIEGDLVLDDLDIFAEVGKNAAFDQTFTVEVTDGVLDLDFDASVDNAKLAGLVIRTSDADAPSEPVNLPPVVTEDTIFIFEDTPLTFGPDLFATDPEGETVFFEFVEGVENGTFQLAGENSIAFYTPDPDFSGTETLTIGLSDRSSQGTATTITTLNIEVVAANDRPFAADDTATTEQGQSVLIDVLANDGDVDGDPIFADIIDGPSNGVVTEDATGAVIYQPFANFVGTDTFTYQAVDDSTARSDTVTVTVDVEAPPEPVEPTGDPILAFNAGGIATVLDGVSYEADRTSEFLATGSTRAFGGNSAVHTSERYGEAFTLDIPLENGTYDVTLNFAEVYFNAAGARVFDVSIEGDLVLDDLDIFAEVGKNVAFDQTFTVEVTDGVLDLDFDASVNNAKLAGLVIRPGVSEAPVNLPPVVIADTVFVDEGGSLTLTPSAFAEDPEGETLFFEFVNGVENGTFQLMGANSIAQYTPDAGFSGTETLTIGISDRTGQGTVQTTTTLNIEVLSTTNEAPTTIADPTVSVAGGSSVTIDVLANDTDPEGDALSIEITRQPDNGTLSIGPDGVTYTPNDGFVGEDDFVYRAVDSAGNEGNGAVNRINVTEPEPEAEAIASYALFDTVTDTLITEVADGDEIALSLLEGRSVTVVATPTGDDVLGAESARFDFDGLIVVESVEPYVLFGDIGGDFKQGASFDAGEFAIEVAWYEGNGASGAVLGLEVLDFTVIDDTAGLAAPSTNDLLMV